MYIQLMSIMGACAMAAAPELEALGAMEVMIPTEATGPAADFAEVARRLDGGVRRRSGTRVAPAPQTEAEYESSVDPGRGWDHNTGYWRGIALEAYTGDIKEEEYSLEMDVTKDVIKSQAEFGEAMRSTASIKGSGWGMRMQVDASFEREIKMQSKDAIFLFHGDKDLGYEGWKFEDVPPLKAAAEATLCDQGVLTIENFEATYGTYYVMGVRKAIALDIWIKISTQTSSTDQKVTASVQGAWNGMGRSLEGSASFAHELHEESSYTDVEVRAKAYGVDNTWFPDVDLETVDQLVAEFKTMSGGSGIAHVLYRYDDHPDFQRIVNECGNTVDSLQADEYWMEKITDIAIEARLIAEQMMDGPYDECRYGLGSEAYTLFDALTKIPADQIGMETYLESVLGLHELKEKWDADNNACIYKCWTKPTFCNLATYEQCHSGTLNAYWGGDRSTEGQCQWNSAKDRCEQKTTFCELANYEQCHSTVFNAVWAVEYTSANYACIWAVGNQQDNTELAAHAYLPNYPGRK